MSDIMTIEQLDETSASELVDSDLLMTSVNNGNGVYTSKKMTLSALADYVNSKSGSGSLNFNGGGLEIYDMSKATATDNTKDYYFDVKLGGDGGKAWWSNIIYQDCVVFTRGGHFADSSGAHWKVTINGKEIELEWFKNDDTDSRTKFYLKKGQTLKIEKYNSTDSPAVCNVSTFPLSSGGMFFIDTSKIAGNKLESQVVSDSTIKNNWTYQNTNNYPVAIGVKSSNEYQWTTDGSCKIDGYNAYPQREGDNSYLWFLNPNQTLQIQNLSVTKYCVFPLLPFDKEIEMDSVQLWENGPYWATRNIGAKRDIDFGAYFQYGGLNGYRYENNVYVGNGSDNFEFTTNSSLVYGKSREQLLQGGIITQDNVLTPNYDAATQKYGSEWKIPSYNDWIALNSYCDMYWTRKNGVEGVMITGRNAYADKSIFLPNAGEAGSNGPTDQIRYSSTKVSYGPTTTQAANAECAYFTNSGQSEQVLVQAIRAVQDGLPIRPIKIIS